MNRTHKLLAAFVPPVVAGVAVGVCGGCGSDRSTDNAPTSEIKAPDVRKKTADETAISRPSGIGDGEKMAGNKKEDFDEEAVETAVKEILEVLDKQPVDRSKWVTKDDLAKKLPNIKPELLYEALDYLKEDDTIIVVKDDSGIEYYGKRNTRHG